MYIIFAARSRLGDISACLRTQLFAASLVDLSRPLAVTCGSGNTACIVAAALYELKVCVCVCVCACVRACVLSWPHI